MGLYDRWKYRAYLRASSPATVANYPHKLTLFWLPGMRNDFRDIRVVTISGQRCRYWIESYTSRTSATVWVKIPPSGQPGILLFYGNNAVASESSGSNVFDFFDDFSGAALDTTTRWSVSGLGGTPSLSGGICPVVAPEQLYSKASFGTGYAIRTRASMPYDKYASISFWDAAFGNEYVQFYGNYPTANQYSAIAHTAGGADTAALGTSYTGYHVWEMCRNASTNNKFYIDGSLVATHSTKIPTSSRNVMIYAETSGVTINLDWICVRKFVATDPTLSLVWHEFSPAKNDAVREYVASIPYAGTEYVWDPVNVDHGRSAGVGPQEIEMGPVNIYHARSAGVGPQEIEMGPVNIYHARYPTAMWNRIADPVADTGLMVSVTVNRGMEDAMATAEFHYETDAIGNYFSGDYMTKILVTIPDYNGVNRVVFVGICPSSRATYSPAADKMTLTAVDYGLYLTKQILEDKDLALLPPDEQTEDNMSARILSFDFITTMFQLGMKVIGKSSGAIGTVIELVSGASWRMTLYPATGDYIDNEDLLVGGVKFAQADGRSVHTSYTPYYSKVYPEDWVKSVLGGENRMRVTGLEPQRITNSSGYWDTEDCPAVPFMFGSKDKKMDAIKRLAKYMRYIQHIKPRLVGGQYVPAFYFVKETDIDTPGSGLDLPPAVSITGPNDPYLVTPIELEQNGENQVDVVRVTCQDLNGTWLTSKKMNSRASNGEGPYLEFYDEPQDIATQTDLDAYCDDMFTLYSARGATWQATLLERSDLELYQLLNISGYGTKIPDGTYRIVKISYEYGAAINKTQITFMLATAFSTRLRYGRVYTDSINEIQRIVKGEADKTQTTELGTCIATDGLTVTYETEAGVKGRGRDGTVT